MTAPAGRHGAVDGTLYLSDERDDGVADMIAFLDVSDLPLDHPARR